MNVRNLIIAWVEDDEGNYVEIGIDGETDYRGNNVNDAMEAVTDCDEITIGFHQLDGERKGWGLIVNEYGEDPEIADCTQDLQDFADEMEDDDRL